MRPLVTVSGTPVAPGRPSAEEDPLSTAGQTDGRSDAVTRVLGLAPRGVRSSTVSLPRTAHHDGQAGFTGLLTENARRTGIAGCPGDDAQRWPAVHALDAAVLFRLVLEGAPGGSSRHVVADEGVAVGDMAGLIGRRLGLPVEPVPEETFGPLGPVFATGQSASSARTRAELGWSPVRPGLLADLENLGA